MPTCLHYSIKWKVTVNKKVISRDTEQDLVLAPMAYWHEYLSELYYGSSYSLTGSIPFGSDSYEPGKL